MMKKIYKWLILMLIVNISALSAQEASTLYFMEKNAMRHQLNPAYRPDGNFHFGIPVYSSINFNLGNNCLTFEDVYQGQTVNGKKQTVSFLSRYADNGIDNFLDAMNDNWRLYADYNLMLLSFGFKIKEKHYITFGLANRADVQLSIPKALPRALLKGNGDVDARVSFGIEDMSAVATLYSELALGYSYKFDEKLSLGIKPKFLLGHANVRTDFQDMRLTIDKDEWKLTGEGSIDMSVPTIQLTKKEDGAIDDIGSDDDFVFSDCFAGMGGALDLGASYQLFPNLNLSASVLDLGFIRWRKNLNSLRKKTDFVFDGIAYEIEDRDTVDYGKEYEDILKNMYTVSNAKAYSSWLTTKVLLAAEYGVWNNRMTFGLLSKTYILQRKMYEEMMLSANFKPWRIFSMAVSYSLLDGEWHNLGLATNFNFGPVNLYAAMDQIPLMYAKGDDFMIPTKTRGVNVSTGLNFVFGYKAKKEKTKEEETPVVIPVDTLMSDTVQQALNNEVVADSIQTEPQDTTAEIVVEPELEQPADTVLPEPKQVVDTIQPLPADTIIPVKEEEKSETVDEGELIEAALYGIRYSQDGHLMILDERCYPLLNTIAQRMKEDRSLKLLIRGHYHLDGKGPEYSRFMSKERARLVLLYLVEQGIAVDRMTVEGVGAEMSIAPNNTAAGQAKNRRMEMRYRK